MKIKYNNDEEVENKLLGLYECVWESLKQLHITEVLEHILSWNWRPVPPNAKQLKWYDDLYEIKIQFWSDLYRINYFVDKEWWYMVLLNWYYKPDWRSNSDNYNKSKKKKLDREIEQYINEAELLKENYFLNKWNYELFS